MFFTPKGKLTSIEDTTGEILDVDKNTLSLIVDIAYLAIDEGKWQVAAKIFDHLKIARPQSSTPYIGLALAFMAANKNKQMLEILQNDAMAKYPDDQLVAAYLGLALFLNNQQEKAYSILSKLVKSPEKTTAVEMAEEILLEMQANKAGGNSITY
jgi:thioredoxin-like negative regulator of GroEL